MKKLIFLCLVALSFTTAQAQDWELKTGQHMMGYYVTDDLPEAIFTNGVYLGLCEYPGTNYHASVVYETQVTQRFVGGKITKFRYAMADHTSVKGYFICEVQNDYDLLVGYDPVVEVLYDSPITPEIGWNYVTLDEADQVEIQADKFYILGYIYDQTTENLPLVTDRELQTDYSSQYGLFVYGALTSAHGLDWYWFPEGQLCIQAVVDGGDFGDYDIALRDLKVSNFVQQGGQLDYSFSLVNYGLKDVSTYTISVEIDGEELDVIDTPFALSGSALTYTGSIALPESIVAGTDTHSFQVHVTTINGTTPSEYTDDDTLQGTFQVYSETVERQKYLIEQLTSVQCVNCPKGYDMIEMMLANNPGKYSWAALHSSGMGTDPYYISYVDYPEYFYGYLTYNYSWGWPSAIFNRAYLDAPEIDSSGSVGLIFNWSENQNELAAELIDAAIDKVYASIPAFVSVNISPDYDETTSLLNITVSGSGVEFARGILADNVLYVYIIEDGLTGYQLGATNSNNYLHRNVLRYVATSTYGDEIGWTSDSEYVNTYSVPFDSEWKADNVRIIAFITGPMVTSSGGTLRWADPYNAYVNNCEEVTIDGTVVSAGIEKTVAEEDIHEVARYTTDGRCLSAPVKGINILRMSDGSVKKIYVK